MEKHQFKPFEKVLVRDSNKQPWKCGIFSNYTEDEEYKYECVGNVYAQCIPYNENTMHLLGTTEPYEQPKPKTYRVQWVSKEGSHTEEYTDEEFENFIKIAVLHNKDVSNFNVQKICG